MAEKMNWAPKEILERLKKLNKKEKLNLKEEQIELILAVMKGYYERNEQERLKKMEEEF